MMGIAIFILELLYGWPALVRNDPLVANLHSAVFVWQLADVNIIMFESLSVLLYKNCEIFGS